MLNLKKIISLSVLAASCTTCSGSGLLLSVATGSETTDSTKIGRNAGSDHCPPFDKTPFYRKPSNSITANPENWIQTINNAAPGDEIALEDGVYQYDSYAVTIDKPLTLRGKSKSPQQVIIQGRGYGDLAEGLMVMADDVHIADLTIQDVHHHAISLQEGVKRSVIYNVSLIDIGTQHIKSNRAGPNGLIACSDIGYRNAVGTGDYNGGIDLHGATEWTIRDNNIYNIFGDGSGCVVDRECGTQYPGGGAAILLWQSSKNNIIERNTITESFRGISLGLNSSYSGGVVRNNFVHRKLSGKEGVNGFIEADTGISLIRADNVLLEGNTVMLAGDYPGAIEVWKATRNRIRNNVISKPIWNRGNADYNVCQSPTSEDCDSPEFGNIVVTFDNYVLSHNHQSDLSMQHTEMQNIPDSARRTRERKNELLISSQHLLLQLRQDRALILSDLLKIREERILLLESVFNKK